MLFIRSDVLFDFINPKLPKNTKIFVIKYVFVFYGKSIFYGLNLVHTAFFTLWGFILRFSVIGDISLLKTYFGYFLVYFVFGVGFRLLDNVMCFLFIKYFQRNILLAGDDELLDADFENKNDKPLNMPPPPRASGFWSSLFYKNTTPSTPPQSTPPKQTPHFYETLASRILTGKHVKGACLLLGTCFALHVSWEAFRANNIAERANDIAQTTHDYTVYKGERDFLWERFRHNQIDAQTFDAELQKLQERYNQK
jgi:hypothetical protein